MEYIDPEEFLKQDEEIQKVFLDWWQPSIGDLYCECHYKKRLLVAETKDIYKGYLIPLLTEGQLRKFIEDKTSGTIDTTKENSEEYTITIWYAKGKELFNYYKFYKVKANNLFQVYWEVALEIAKEEIN